MTTTVSQEKKVDDMSCLPSLLPAVQVPQFAFQPFIMPTSKSSILQRDTLLRSQVYRELTLATLKDPNSWDACWKPLLLVYILLRYYPHFETLQDHPYVYERWWDHSDTLGAGGVNLKLLLSNHDGTSMVLLGTSVWDADQSTSTRWVTIPVICCESYLESEVSSQLQRLFSQSMSLFEGVRLRSIVVSCWDEDVRGLFEKGARELEKSWRCGTVFTF